MEINYQLEGTAGQFEAVDHDQQREDLELILDFDEPKPLSEESLHLAQYAFFTVLRDFTLPEPALGYKPDVLLQQMHEEVQMKEELLRYLFTFLEQHVWQTPVQDLDLGQALKRYFSVELLKRDEKTRLAEGFVAFADHLINTFFLPMKASGPTPQESSSSFSSRHSRDILTNPHRSSTLRRACFTRDGHRCVITHKFDIDEADARRKKDGMNAKDDDGQPIDVHGPYSFAGLQACHIIPHSLSGGAKRPPPNATAWHILGMFDSNIVSVVGGRYIDEPYNAITLTTDYHNRLGKFSIYFESIGVDNRYTIDFWNPSAVRDMPFPVTRELRTDPTGKIRPPSARLLAIHRAIGKILYLSGAGERIDELLRDIGDIEVLAEDGKSNIGHLLFARLGGSHEIRAH